MLWNSCVAFTLMHSLVVRLPTSSAATMPATASSVASVAAEPPASVCSSAHSTPSSASSASRIMVSRDGGAAVPDTRRAANWTLRRRKPSITARGSGSGSDVAARYADREHSERCEQNGSASDQSQSGGREITITECKTIIKTITQHEGTHLKSSQTAESEAHSVANTLHRHLLVLNKKLKYSTENK